MLHLIRKIRNSFAHEITGATLNSGGHVDRIRELSMPLKKYKEYISFRQSFFEGLATPATDFRTVLTILMVRLTSVLDNTNQFLTIHNKALSLRPEKWVKGDALIAKRKERLKIKSAPKKKP